jgi:PAS domain S-box-containing protein
MKRLVSYIVRPPILPLFAAFSLLLFVGAGVLVSEAYKYSETKNLQQRITRDTRQISFFLASVNNLVGTLTINEERKVAQQKFLEELVRLYPNIRAAWIKNNDNQKVIQADTGDILHISASFDHEVGIFGSIGGERIRIGSFGIQWNMTKDYQAIDERVKKLRIYATVIAIGLFLTMLAFTLWFVIRPVNNRIYQGDKLLSGNLSDTSVADTGVIKEFYILSKQVNRFGERLRFMRQREKEITAIINAALDGVISIDSAGEIITFNPAAEAIFGHSAKDVVGKDMADIIIPPALRDAHRRGIVHYLKTGEHKVLGQRIEITALHKNGHEFPIELAIESIVGAGGTTFVAYLRDISKQKELEQEQAIESKKSQNVTRVKTALLGATTQEVAIPMKGMDQSLSQLKETQLSENQSHLVDTLSNTTKLLSFFIQDLVELSKFEAGSIDLEFSTFTIKTTIDEAISLAQKIIPSKNIKYAFDIAGDVPKKIVGDGHRYNQILLNLIIQASQYTDIAQQPDDNNMLIRLKSIPVEASTIMLRTEISNKAIRLPSGFRENLNNSNNTMVNGDMALNFILPKKLIDLMGGKIDVIDEKENGAMFWFEIPATIVD